MTLEQKRAFIRLITQEVRLDSLSDRLMRLTLVWHPVLAGEEHTEFTILEKSKGSGANWTEDEDAILHELYPQVQRSDILIALPRRSWVAIKSRAKALDVSRYTYATGEFQIPDTLALEDWILSQESGIEPGEWTSEATVKLNGTVRATIPVQ
ncbi:MAG: hypothetical protein AUH94_04735 [Ktedonobacter sp. 13_2_20CM_2_54_8]|nr:MAG: hypothetical protein AUH94_04735 [Ktedonobacter sp. 13_2_20CM_2_54_8]